MKNNYNVSEKIFKNYGANILKPLCRWIIITKNQEIFDHYKKIDLIKNIILSMKENEHKTQQVGFQIYVPVSIIKVKHLFVMVNFWVRIGIDILKHEERNKILEKIFKKKERDIFVKMVP